MLCGGFPLPSAEGYRVVLLLIAVNHAANRASNSNPTTNILLGPNLNSKMLLLGFELAISDEGIENSTLKYTKLYGYQERIINFSMFKQEV